MFRLFTSAKMSSSSTVSTDAGSYPSRELSSRSREYYNSFSSSSASSHYSSPHHRLISRSSRSPHSSFSTLSSSIHINNPTTLSLKDPSDSIILNEARGSPNSSSSLRVSSSSFFDRQRHPRTFPISATDRHGDRRPHPPDELQTMIQTASNCYHALDYNQMIFVLQSVKLTPDLDPIEAMAISFGLGLGHYKLSSYETSMLHFLKMETLAKEEEGEKGETSNLALVSYYLAELEYSQNKFLSAAGYFEISAKSYVTKGADVGATLYNVHIPSLSSLYCKCGTALRYGSKVMEAIKAFRKGVDLANSSSDWEDKLSAHTSLGNLYQSLGEFSKAVDEYQETLKLSDKLEDYVSLGWAHGNVGNAYLGLGKIDKALGHLKTALELTLEHEPVPQAIGRAYNNLGTAYQSSSCYGKAREYYELGLNQAIYGNDLPGQARVYGNLGNLLMLENKYSEAIVHYTETLTISKDRATHVTAYHNRGCARFERAEEERQKYLADGAGNSELTTGKKSNLIFIGADVNDTEEEHKFLMLPDSLIKHYRDSQSDLERVVKHHEQTFKDIKGSQRGLSLSVSLFETNVRTFQRLQDCSFFLNQWEQALVCAEQCRSRTLGELLLGKHSNHLKYSFRTPLDLPQIISIVKDQSLPVVYITYTGSRILIWLLVPVEDKPMSVSINLSQVALEQEQFDGKSFDHLVRLSLSESLIEDNFNMYDMIDYTSHTLLNDLHSLIASPLLRLLKSVVLPEHISSLQDLILICDSHTNLIPIAALQDDTSRRFLGDDFRFHSMSSLLTLGVMQQLPSPVVTLPLDPINTCIVGNPFTSPFQYQGNTWNLGRLPYAEEEAQRVAHALGTVPLLGKEAMKNVVLSRIKNSKIVHLATHGNASSGFLIFSGSSPISIATDPEFAKSVLLFTQDIETITIPAALVVLSSCDSGRGIVKMDGIQGIARSFLLAGAQSVLTSLWRVPDESASFFMHFFYQYLVDGLPSFKALQKACHSIRCYAKYSGYIHWSGYQLQGREIQFEKNMSAHGEKKELKRRIGDPSSFPQLNELLKIKQSLLVDSKYVPRISESIGFDNDRQRELKLQKALLYPQRADVQLLVGTLGSCPQEVAKDYIFSTHSLYKGGIYWIPGHSPDLTAAALQHIEESVCPGSSLEDFFDNQTEQILLVLDSFHSLPLIQSPLKKLMLTTKCNVHILLTASISSTPETLGEQCHYSLTRGYQVHSIKPVHCLSASQRLIYNVVSQFDLAPMNDDQKIFNFMEELACGQPPLINITNSLLTDCIETSSSSISEALKKFNQEVIIKTFNEIEAARLREEKASPDIKQKSLEEVQALSLRIGGLGLLKKPNNVTESLVSDTIHKTAIIYAHELIGFAKLDPLEHLILCCLCFLYCTPVHCSVIDGIKEKINDIYQDLMPKGEYIEKATWDSLVKFNFIVHYPHPVVQAPSSNQETCPEDETYYIVPPVVCEAVQLSMNESDKIVVSSLLHYVLINLRHQFEDRYRIDEEEKGPLKDTEKKSNLTFRLPSPVSTTSKFMLLHFIALHGFLLGVISDDFKLYGRDIIATVAKDYIKDKLRVQREDAFPELVMDMIL